jgi:tetratricopeptide (TPR) repeat protein
MKWTSNSPWRLVLLCLVLCSVTLATFWPVLQNGFINYDDPDYVTANDMVQKGLNWEGVKWAFKTGHASNWHPVTWLSHMCDTSLFGLNPMCHHLVNLLFHTANTILLLLLLHQMTGVIWRSAVVALLFAIHPLHVESVAWVAERKDVLSTFFGLLTLMAYGRYAAESKVSGLKPKVWYAVALLLFALGLMSKPMLVTWPFVMLLLDYWPLGRVTFKEGKWKTENGQSWVKLVWEKAPFAALVIASSVITVFVQKAGGAMTTALNLPLEDRIANAIASYWKYLGKTLWPTDLAIFYPHPETRYPVSEQWPTGVILLAGLALGTIAWGVMVRRREKPYLALGWFWYLGTLIPVIGIVQVGTQAMADRYTYIPLIGIFIGLVWAAGDLSQRIRYGRPLASVVSLAVAFCCMVLTRSQLTHWRDSFSVFKHATEVTKYNAPAHANLATEFINRDDYEPAVEHLNAALAANPHFADAHYSLGLVAQKQGALESAATSYLAALQTNPRHLLARHNLGSVLWLQGKHDEAEKNFREALELKPDFYEANLNLGNLLLEQGNPGEAERYFQNAIQIQPSQKSPQVGRALALKMQGRWAEAETEFRYILQTDPDHLEAWLNLGLALKNQGQTNEATSCFMKVTQLNSKLDAALVAAGQDLAAHGKMVAAEDRLEAAIALNPINLAALENLALLQAQAGKLDNAAGLYEQALRQKPNAESHYYLALIQALQGKVAGSITNLQQAILLSPNHLAAMNELAWLLATHPDDKIRNGPKAVELAERAKDFSGGKEARYWGTLDAAYAEVARFSEAIQAAERAKTLAEAAGEQEIALAAAARQMLYRDHKPFRQQPVSR